MIMSINKTNKNILDVFKDKYEVFDPETFKITDDIITSFSDKKYNIDEITKLFKNGLKRVLKTNYTELDTFLIYLRDEETYHIIKDKMIHNSVSIYYDILVDEIKEKALEYFERYRERIIRESKKYQLNRFNNTTPPSKFEYYLDSFIASQGTPKNRSQIYYSQYILNLTSNKICIPTNIYFFLYIVDAIVTKVCKEYCLAKKRSIEYTPKKIDKYIKVKLY